MRSACHVLRGAAAASASLSGVSASRVVVRAPLQMQQLACRAFSAAPTAAPAKASMAAIKQLRDRTGAPITECKDALQSVLAAGAVDASNEAALMEAAVEALRKKGISTAAKKSGRVASEGLVVMQQSAAAGGSRAAALVEVNSETDFAARNTTFRALCTSVSHAALQLAHSGAATGAGEMELSSLQGAECADPTATGSAPVAVSTALTNVVSTLRENVQVRRTAGLRVERGVIGGYVHNAVANEEGAPVDPNVRMGRQACIVAVQVQGGDAAAHTDSLQQVANKLAMQIVAATPRFVSRADVPASLIDAERAVLTEQANAAPIAVPGQPIKKAPKPKDAAQLAKMMDGKINKWLSEIVLLEQQFVVGGGEDGAKPPTVSQVLQQEAAKLGDGATVTVTAFQRFLVGEGVVNNKGADSFAKEVAEKLAKAQ